MNRKINQTHKSNFKQNFFRKISESMWMNTTRPYKKYKHTQNKFQLLLSKLNRKVQHKKKNKKKDTSNLQA